MKNHLLILVLSFFITGICVAQQPGLMVKSQDSNLFVEHTVAAKEGIYSIGRLYNVHPRHLASFNSLDLSKGLNIGQVINIPLTDTNFNQKTNKGLPVYYTVGEGEGLMKVSNSNRKVTLKSIREWNKLSSDVLKPGAQLIVGYLNSPESGNIVINKSAPAIDKPIAAVQQPVLQPDQSQSGQSGNKPVETPSVVEQKQPVVQSRPETVNNKPEAAPGDEGFFRSYFDQQIKVSPASKQNTVTAGIFKTVSGWQDAKYYLLIDDVPTGSIVKVVNPENSKTVYAKVLGEMNGIRQNQGLGIRISSAGASALGITDTEKFIVKVHY